MTTALTFPAGSNAMQCAAIALTDDVIFEADESFNLMIDVTTVGVTEGNTLTIVHIFDNDGWSAPTVKINGVLDV